jgi:hypothetical protein
MSQGATRRIPMPADLLALKPDLEQLRAQLTEAQREEIRLASLRSGRYLLHEIALRFLFHAGSKRRAAAV